MICHQSLKVYLKKTRILQKEIIKSKEVLYKTQDIIASI